MTLQSMLTIRAKEHSTDTCNYLRPYAMQTELTWAVLVALQQSKLLLSATNPLIL